MWVLMLDFLPCVNYSKGCGLCLSLSFWLLRALLLWGLFNCYVWAERETVRGNVLYSSWPPTMLHSWRPGVICLFRAGCCTVKYSASQTMDSFFPSWMEIFFPVTFFFFSCSADWFMWHNLLWPATRAPSISGGKMICRFAKITTPSI